jgi:predicted RNA binding protein YcfA (HicA-like mRNA interferase family)
MTGAEVLAIMRRRGCEVVRRRGSHVRVRCGTCTTTVPVHAGQDLPRGTLRAIERHTEPCLGVGWLRTAS